MKKSKIILHEETRLLYEGTDLHVDGVRPDSPPIYPATAYIMRDLQELSNQVDADGFVYNRCQNPDRFALGDMISNLELGKHTLVCSSGMNAICVTMLATLEKGDHVVANAALYGEVIDFMSNILPKYGIEVTFTNFLDTEEVHKAIKPQTKMLYTEIIANPLTEVIDVKEIANIAHQHNALLVVDSTVTTPFVIRPLEFGADIVLHSLTKYFGGHSDLTAGSVTLNDDKVYQTIRNLYILMGCATDSVTSWLCMRSIRTMGMRMDRQLSNAEKLAEGLSKCPYVRKVVHPSLESHPQHELAKRQFRKGYGALLSFYVKNDRYTRREQINEFLHKLEFVEYLTTLGGIKTTLSHPVSSSHYGVPEEIRLKMGITEGLIRVSVGVEDIDDLLGDFYQALEVFA